MYHLIVQTENVEANKNQQKRRFLMKHEHQLFCI